MLGDGEGVLPLCIDIRPPFELWMFGIRSDRGRYGSQKLSLETRKHKDDEVAETRCLSNAGGNRRIGIFYAMKPVSVKLVVFPVVIRVRRW